MKPFLIRRATKDDAATLRRLAALDSQAAFEDEALVAELDGTPAAAISLRSGRVVSDPFMATAGLRLHLRLAAA